MTPLAVSRLRLRGPPALAALATARVEDALRLAAPAGDRLLVLRRLHLGRLPVIRAAPWDARAASAVREAGARALHALAPGAALAEAVWFASAAEARLLLLRELAAGRRPQAWFWRLAVPEWRGASLAEWVPRLVARARADPAAEIAFARAVLRLAEDAHLAPVAAALAFAPEPPSASAQPRPSAPARMPAPHERHGASVPGLAERLLARLPPGSRARILAAIRTAPPEGRAVRWLARLAILAASPEAATQPALSVALAEAVLADAVPEPETTRPHPFRPPASAPPPRAGDMDAQAPGRTSPTRRAPITTRVPDAAAPLAPRATPADAPAPHQAVPFVGSERYSRAAGLMLLVRPLVRMGLPAWLDRHPDLAAAGFARALLRHIALRHRIAPEDPLLTLFDVDEAHPRAALHAWRIGLDRWLRRRTRRRLHDIARRPGWLAIAEDSITLRFPAEAADLNLRRLALDVDPGWVPWLGLAIRYHFRDDPLP